MNKTTKLLLLFGSTAVLWIAGLILFFGLIFDVVKSNEALATFQAPGSAQFTIEEPSSITVWHDYETIFDNTTVRHERALPSGYRFEVVTETGAPLDIKFSNVTTTMEMGSVSKVAIGTLSLADGGNYQIKVNGPDAAPRIISVSKGVFKDTFFSMLSGIGVIFLFGLLGLITLIFGIVVAMDKSELLK